MKEKPTIRYAEEKKTPIRRHHIVAADEDINIFKQIGVAAGKRQQPETADRMKQILSELAEEYPDEDGQEEVLFNAVRACARNPDESIALGAMNFLLEKSYIQSGRLALISGSVTKANFADAAKEERNWKFAKEILESLAERAMKEAKERGEVLTPLLEPFFLHFMREDARAQIRGEADVPFPGQIARESLEEFIKWLENKAQIHDLDEVPQHESRFTLYKPLERVILRHSRTLASEEGVLALMSMAKSHPVSAARNNHLTRESANILMDTMLDTITELKNVPEPSGFFVILNQKGFGLDEGHMRRVRTMARDANRPTRSTATTTKIGWLAVIPEVAADPSLRQIVINDLPGTHPNEYQLWRALAISSRGTPWEHAVKKLIKTAPADIISQTLAKANEWHLEGAGKEVLLAATGHKYSNIRAEGIRLLGLQRQMEGGETPPSTTTPSPGKTPNPGKTRKR